MIDFKKINSYLLFGAENLLSQWFPAGKKTGNEFCVGDIKGNPGKSFSVNLSNGAWLDHSNPSLKGGDLISLYAAIHGISQADAAKKLEPHNIVSKNFSIPPNDGHWQYTDSSGITIMHLIRKNEGTSKRFVPYTCINGEWVSKSLTPLRPIYKLHEIISKKNLSIVIVEGEKAADACQKIMGDRCIVTTWPHGALSVAKTDWMPLKNRNVLIWPDADSAGKKAMHDICAILSPIASEIKFLNVPDNEGWDAADALKENYDYKKFSDWAEPLIENYEPEPELSEVVPVEPLIVIWDRFGITRNGRGVPVANADNCMRILENHSSWKGKIWYDEFYDKPMTTIGTNSPRFWTDTDTLQLLIELQRSFGLSSVGKDSVATAISVIASNDRRNEPLDWLNEIKWDGIARIDDFFIDYMKCSESEYTKSVGKNFWISMVARIALPGCQVDTMPILQSGEGTRKTSALRAIGGKWYLSMIDAIGSKDFYELIQGKILCEIAELESFRNAEMTKIKAVLTTITDTHRRKYGTYAEDKPRRCVFVGTTNESHYLRSTTGLRRFWPLSVGHIDVNGIKLYRSQFFAEAYARLKNGEDWHTMPEEETRFNQHLRLEIDEWETILERYAKNKYTPDGISGADAAKDALNIPLEKLDNRLQRRIGAIFRKLGMYNGYSKDVDGITERRWFWPISSAE